jgi:imidazoleglycerol-phosphate dehydratase
MSTIERETRETSIRVTVIREGGEITVDTSVPFLDHMLLTWARYAGVGLTLHARGDLRHHLIEDVGIALGAALKGAIPATAARYGHRIIPMDEALVECAIDVGGRYYYEGPLPSTLYDHFMRSFAEHAGSTLHLRVLRGTDRHHIVEGAFKALGLAIRDALVDSGAVFSTKGSVALRRERDDAGSGAPDAPATGDGARVAATSARSEGPSRGARPEGTS